MLLCLQTMNESIANIYDVTGKLIKTENISKGNNSIVLNANPGYYIVKLINGNTVKSQKIITTIELQTVTVHCTY